MKQAPKNSIIFLGKKIDLLSVVLVLLYSKLSYVLSYSMKPIRNKYINHSGNIYYATYIRYVNNMVRKVQQFSPDQFISRYSSKMPIPILTNGTKPRKLNLWLCNLKSIIFNARGSVG